MPKVSKLTVKIEGKDVDLTINYSSKNKFSCSDIPEKVKKIVGVFIISGSETEKLLHQEIKKVIDSYHALIANEKKVIVYSLQLPYCKVKDTSDHWNAKYHTWIPDSLKDQIQTAFDYKFGFMIDYRVLIKRVDKDVKYFESKEGRTTKEVHISKGEKNFEIDWTEEREAFFSNLEMQADEMVKKLLAFFGQETSAFLNFIDNGKHKLLS